MGRMRLGRRSGIEHRGERRGNGGRKRILEDGSDWLDGDGRGVDEVKDGEPLLGRTCAITIAVCIVGSMGRCC